MNVPNKPSKEVICTEEEKVNKSLEGKFRERYPELENVNIETDELGKVRYILITTKIPDG